MVGQPSPEDFFFLEGGDANSNSGGWWFFVLRYRNLRGNAPPKQVAKELHCMCLKHLQQREGNRRIRRKLYRIFFYDCRPLSKKVHNPITRQCIDFSKSPTAQWRIDFHNELRQLRKVALRFGYLNERSGHWEIRENALKRLFSREIGLDDLTERDVRYDVSQKGVDMRIGLDIASMCFKKQVDQIILISGDSDFVAAAKLARREGIDFILDPMWASIRPDLNEHIDGLRSVFERNHNHPSVAAAPKILDNATNPSATKTSDGQP
jgi:uncharacterized LabA/DUF88 family protein